MNVPHLTEYNCSNGFSSYIIEKLINYLFVPAEAMMNTWVLINPEDEPKIVFTLELYQ